MSDRLNLEQTVAVVVVVAALLFVAYNEASDTLSGAIVYSNKNLRNCYDTDTTNLPTVRGTVTAEQLNAQTNQYSPITPLLDTCVPEGGNKVQEYSCKNNKPIREGRTTYCPKGTVCRAGACS